jgi:hypothetical protein
MTWHGGSGFGWADCLLTLPMVVVLWAAIIAAVVIAFRYHLSDQRGTANVIGSSATVAPDVFTESRSRGGIYDDDFNGRLM